MERTSDVFDASTGMHLSLRLESDLHALNDLTPPSPVLTPDNLIHSCTSDDIPIFLYSSPFVGPHYGESMEMSSSFSTLALRHYTGHSKFEDDIDLNQQG